MTVILEVRVECDACRTQISALMKGPDLELPEGWVRATQPGSLGDFCSRVCYDAVNPPAVQAPPTRICAYCKGRGSLRAEFLHEPNRACHACGGSGVVT